MFYLFIAPAYFIHVEGVTDLLHEPIKINPVHSETYSLTNENVRSFKC